MDNIEQLIMSGILSIPDFRLKVLPHIEPELIESEQVRVVYQAYQNFKTKYGTDEPSSEALQIIISNTKGISDDTAKESVSLVKSLYTDEVIANTKSQPYDWLVAETQRHLINRSCFNALMDSLKIIDGEDKKLTIDAIPDMFKSAISISFDTSIGHDYLEDAESRFDFYHEQLDVIPFELTMLNKITNGGMRNKSLIVALAPTGVGKTLFMTNEAGFQLMSGNNVLYITLEMASERISERIDAKLMDLDITDLKDIPKDTFMKKITKMKNNTVGKLIVNEYPSGTFNANNLRFLLNELKTKKNFVPKVIFIDYLNLLSSYRMKDPGNSYAYIKSVAEELRGVALEKGLTIITATQTNRNGIGASDYELSDISESAGIAHTADLIFGLISTPEMESGNKIRFKQFKNRWGDLNSPLSWIAGVRRARMQIYDIDLPGRSSQPDNKPVESSTFDIFSQRKPKQGALKT